VDAATRHVTRLQFATVDADGEPAVWLLTFTDFDAPVTIEPPAAH
jgi:hypothetical protein